MCTISLLIAKTLGVNSTGTCECVGVHGWMHVGVCVCVYMCVCVCVCVCMCVCVYCNLVAGHF